MKILAIFIPLLFVCSMASASEIHTKHSSGVGELCYGNDCAGYDTTNDDDV